MQRFSVYASMSVLTMFLLLPPVGQAETLKAVPQSQMEMQMSFAPLVKQTSAAVVNVYAERLVQRQSPFAGDPFFEQFFGLRSPNRTQKQSSLGSGVIVEENGTVITNNHVVEGADDIKIALADGREYPCSLVLKDDRLDLAVLKINAKANFPALPIGDSDAVEVGDLVLAIGNPFGVGQTVTSGIVSGLARNQVVKNEFGFFIQTDASINPGNSGGALMNMKGELVGINTAIFSRGGGSNGIGFAIPANLVKVFLASADAGMKSFERPYVGATFEPVTSDIAEALGLDRPRGALIVKVANNSPAAKSGLRTGAVITAVNNVSVEHPDALLYRLTTVGLGKVAKLSVVDSGVDKVLTLALDRAPETQPRDRRTVGGNMPLTGAVVENLSPRVADELRMSTDSTGVVVSEVRDGSPAARVGFEPKDIVIAINGTNITSTQMLTDAAKQQPQYWRVEIERNGERLRQFFR